MDNMKHVKVAYNSFYFTPITQGEITNIVKLFKKQSAPNYDGIIQKIFQNTIELITCPLSLIFNSRFEQGNFPDLLKLARVTPIHKGKHLSVDDKCNYSPISILSQISKLFETLVTNRLRSFLQKHNILT